MKTDVDSETILYEGQLLTTGPTDLFDICRTQFELAKATHNPHFIVEVFHSFIIFFQKTTTIPILIDSSCIDSITCYLSRSISKCTRAMLGIWKT